MSGTAERGGSLSLVIPAYDEEPAIAGVLETAIAALDELDLDYEIIVVDDHSTDRTASIAESMGVTVLRNVQNGGYGYSLLRGIRHARHPTIAIVDADGSYPVADLHRLVEQYRRGFAMVVGMREGAQYMGSRRMRILRGLFRALAQFIVGRPVPDVNSGMRVFEREAVLPLLPHMSQGFSFTTSITLLFMMRTLPVCYVPIEFHKRRGPSKVRYLRDSLRALQILASITARLNPIKLFLLAALLNLAGMLPVLAVVGLWGDVRTPLVVVLSTSVLLVAFGLVVEALIDKSPFGESAPGDDRT
jgi:glycosyltransferase involved in cell wall biosynthesis